MSPPANQPPGDDSGVLGGLSRTRPQRRSEKRSRRPTAPATPAPVPEAGEQRTPKPKAVDRPSTRAAAGPGAARTDPERKTIPPRTAVQVGRDAHEEPRPADTPVPVELVTQAIQAAGELANLGLGIGREVARTIVRRLPRP